MPSRSASILLVLLIAGMASGQGDETRPETRQGALAPADKRPVPATLPEGKRLVADLASARAALDAEQRENPSSTRARTIQLLEEQIETIKRLGARRLELAEKTTENARITPQTDELRKRLVQAGKDEDPLPDPADPQAEV